MVARTPIEGYSDSGLPPGNDRFFGLKNFGNTCYCNSVLQALYFCRPFRECVLAFPPVFTATSSETGSDETHLKSGSSVTFSESEGRGSQRSASLRLPKPNFNQMEESLFKSLRQLFWKISSQKARIGSFCPSEFIGKLRQENELFRNTMHQDAHEFLNFLLNTISEDVCNLNGKFSRYSPSSEDGSENQETKTWVHDLFQGVLTNETKCLTCKTITYRDEAFLDLSIDIEDNTSVSSCLRQFSSSEMLCNRNKFYCDKCNSLQEAEKRMVIRELPHILALHLKRFKYQEKLQRFIKLSYRVVFPFEIRLFNTADSTPNPDRLYSLFAVVVHIGSGPNHGHYVTVVKSSNRWILFDDGNVESLEEEQVQQYFGAGTGTASGYILFYQACDLDWKELEVPGVEETEFNNNYFFADGMTQTLGANFLSKGLYTYKKCDLPKCKQKRF